ncbi:hypothetical protein AUJ46_06535 [Candidatus Peregrinibacteria bacterium CG1_02_54_53]|nr:MAG: hypothetical protein AUJ46_06535 [Candidatus Peregrinibacteria bacterium CG1_02_54_53]
MVAPDSVTIRSLDEIVQYYRSINPARNLFVGIEWERSGVFAKTLEPVQYAGPQGYNAVLHKLVDEVGWEIVQHEGEDIYELQRGQTRITIEGDGRLELAGSPQEIVHDLAREFRIHSHEVEEIGKALGITWMPMGLQPLHSNEQISLVGKARYSIFKDVGDPDLMATMTRRTNGLTANLSFTNEENAIKKAQTAFRVLPIVSAMFACSPFDQGALTSNLDLRRKVIQNHCPERTGIPPNILDDGFCLKDWLKYYADLPVILVSENSKQVRPDGDFSFQQWMENGYRDRFPTLKDFDQHIKTTWSDMRLRPAYLEYRVADSVPFRSVLALPALMKGLLFDSDSWRTVAELTEDWTYEEIIDMDRRSWTGGLSTDVRGVSLRMYAQEALLLANEKLRGFSRMNAENADERIYLQPLKEQIFIKEESFAEELSRLFTTEWNGNIRNLLSWCA